MQYIATSTWTRENKPFEVKTYDRTHDIAFGGGISIKGSAAPEFVGDAKLVNPEELFTASISNCLMLTFLYLAAMKGLVVDEYKAEAIGKLGKNEAGKMAMTDVIIKPQVTFHGETPDAAVLSELFTKAHDNCFISCSVKTKVTIESEQVTAG